MGVRKNSFVVNSIISHFPVKWEVFLLNFFKRQSWRIYTVDRMAKRTFTSLQNCKNRGGKRHSIRWNGVSFFIIIILVNKKKSRDIM